jgi:hypothetical protein
MVAAEASAYLADNVVSYLWTCDTCGYGFVTKHSFKRLAGACPPSGFRPVLNLPARSLRVQLRRPPKVR